MGPLDLELTRQEEAAARQQAQQNTELQQIPESVIKDSTPEQVKPKGKNKLGQRILNLGNQVLKLVITKLQSLAGEYLLDQFIQAKDFLYDSESELTYREFMISATKSGKLIYLSYFTSY